MVGLGGFEPPTSPLSGVRSDQLSYRPGVSRQDRMACVDARAVCGVISLKEVIQPQGPLRLPCYDFTPVADHTVVRVLPGGLDYALLVQPTPMV